MNLRLPFRLWKPWLGLGMSLGLILLTWGLDRYSLYIGSLIGVQVIIALGLNLLVGNAGKLSLGHAGFVAIGAYTLGYLHGVGEWPFLLAMIAAVGISAGCGALLGRAAMRLHGPYFAIATMGFGLSVTTLVGQIPVFGGQMGLQIGKLWPEWTGLMYDRALYLLIIGSAILLTVLMYVLVKGTLGRSLQAIRDHEVAAAATGIPLTRYKTLAFSISAAYAGFAGGCWGLLLGFIQPGLFHFLMSVVFVAGIALGGLGRVSGSIIGASLLTWLSLRLDKVLEWPLVGEGLAWLSENWFSLGGISYVSWVITGGILMMVMIWQPKGLVGMVDKLIGRLGNWFIGEWVGKKH